MKSGIWLTGDVHHMSMNGSDQKLLKYKGLNTSEVELCKPYLEIANQYGFEPTLFFTGKAVEEEYEKINKLSINYKFTIGGHTYSAYQPILVSKISRKLVGSPFPSRKFQYLDIKKTSDIINKRLDVKIKYWRNHAYQSDKNTNKILIEQGFTRVSNQVDFKKFSVEKVDNKMYSFPINTLPDHEYLPHSSEHKGGLDPDKWVDMNIDYVYKIKEKGGSATLLFHPLCMYLEDNFSYMEKVLNVISELN